jgi:AcrR family transcriptional regulator
MDSYASSVSASTDVARPARGETREALVRVAAELLEEGGIEAVTLREVGRRAGVSRAAPYRHFDSKEGLLAAVCAEDLRTLRAALEQAAAKARTPHGALERMLDVFLGSARERPHRYGLLFSSVFRGRDDPELAEAAEECLAVFVAAAAAVLPADDPRRRDPRRVAALMIATAHGVADLERSGHLTREKWGTDGRGVLRQLLAAVAPGSGPS